MKKSLIALSAGLVTVASLGGVAPAAAAQTCNPASATRIIATTPAPARVVVGTTVPRTVNLSAQVEDPCTASVGASVQVAEASLGDVMASVGQIGNVTLFDAGYEIDPAELTDADAGPWLATITARGTTTARAEFTFQLVRATRLTTNARPEAVGRGELITVEGRLTRASWDRGSYRGVPNAPVDLQFRTGPGAYTTIATVRADRRGTVRTQLRAAAEGCFRYRYAGSDTSAAVVSGGDCLRVR